MKDLDKLKEFNGDVLPLITPSGYNVVIRQQNGDDDDVLSNASSVRTGMAMVNFLSGIIVDSDLTTKGTVTPTEASLLRLADAYYILLCSRIFSLGQVLNFEYHWPGDTVPTPYEEDLGLFIWDYSKDFPYETSDSDYYKYRIKPITKDLERKLTLSSGKVIKYTFMNPKGEMYLMNLTDDKQSKNQELLARNIYQESATGWSEVRNFKFFTAQDMREVRRDVEKHDPTLEIFTEIPNPKTGDTILYPILGSPDFFFPRGI